MESRIDHKYYRDGNKKELNQCDILHNISIAIATDYNLETCKYSITEYPLKYAVIINQECDLHFDFINRTDPKAKDQDKILPNILLLPAYLSEDFRRGSHREKLQGFNWTHDLFTQITNNKNHRFHYIEKDEDFQIPDLIVDFKHVYSLKTEMAYKMINEIYYASISELFREDLSNRFAFYLGRIGLPEIKKNQLIS